MILNSKIEVIPAIMPANFNDLRKKAERISGIVRWAQVDVMDGIFVDSHSWPYGTGDAAEFRGFLEEASKLPFMENLKYEVDLMVSAPEVAAKDWIKFGAKRVILHLESTHDIEKILDSLKTTYPKIEYVLAANINTQNGSLDPYIDKISAVQFMGIAKIGYQGEPFDERVIHKIKALRAKYPKVIISVDGGVNFESASRLKVAGVNRLVSGSAIFESENVRGAVERLSR